ncbi:hypothetical protein ncot_06610 [Nocardioides sp. JQ2195]|uniref:hypothetical protein n=1 Tax=Nocardioides sp. JQ2195 TaxID=2592334 RepID=UPI00143E45D5|nr:hypothetical protein [Nocardioides sp. JQ2195]QIX26311.1 hypothetical protein ncot_06610 [Nocardioides sp. JQ2195]
MAGLSLVLLAALVVTWLGKDDPQPPQPHLTSPTARQDLAAEALLDLQAAVRSRDAADLGPDASDAAGAAVANAAALRIADFTLRYVDEDAALSTKLPDGQWAAAVDASWRFAGFDARPAHAEVTFVFEVGAERASIVSVGDGDRRTPLWLAGRVQVRRGPASLVVAAEGQLVDAFAKRARAAVAQVHKVIPTWKQELVVEVPASDEQLDSVLNAEPGDYANIAAVTTTVDGTLSPSAPVHVFVNPEVYSGLKRDGAQVVMTHELVHVATGAATATTTPLWLLEGFADFVALRDSELPLSVTAGQILQKVRSGGAPRALPAGNEFDTRTTHLGASYEAAWLACRLLAQTGSEQDLVRLYRQVSNGGELDAALRQHFGFGEKELVARWRAELRRLAG